MSSGQGGAAIRARKGAAGFAGRRDYGTLWARSAAAVPPDDTQSVALPPRRVSSTPATGRGDGRLDPDTMVNGHDAAGGPACGRCGFAVTPRGDLAAGELTNGLRRQGASLDCRKKAAQASWRRPGGNTPVSAWASAAMASCDTRRAARGRSHAKAARRPQLPPMGRLSRSRDRRTLSARPLLKSGARRDPGRGERTAVRATRKSRGPVHARAYHLLLRRERLRRPRRGNGTRRFCSGREPVCGPDWRHGRRMDHLPIATTLVTSCPTALPFSPDFWNSDAAYLRMASGRRLGRGGTWGRSGRPS